MPKEIDYQDSTQLWRFCMDNVELAELYAETRRQYSAALRHLKLELALAYKKDSIERKLAEEKAYILLASESGCCSEALKILLEKEAEYKGREKVMEARAAALSFNQSLLKIVPKG